NHSPGSLRCGCKLSEIGVCALRGARGTLQARLAGLFACAKRFLAAVSGRQDKLRRRHCPHGFRALVGNRLSEPTLELALLARLAPPPLPRRIPLPCSSFAAAGLWSSSARIQRSSLALIFQYPRRPFALR